MTTGTRIQPPREFFWTTAATQRVGAQMYVYENGTTTPVQLYSDRACLVTAANPVVSASGLFPVRYIATAQLLTIVIKDTAGTEIYSENDIDPYLGAVQGNATDISGTAPALSFTETDQVSPLGRWRWIATAGGFKLQRNTAVAGDFQTASDTIAISSGDIADFEETPTVDGVQLVTTTVLNAAVAAALSLTFGGRLTLTSATPVTTSDVTAATTIYYSPYRGERLPIYDGSAFSMTTFAELSNATAQSSTGSAGPAAVTTNSNYDLFVWNDSGTIRLTRGPAWTSDTARGTGAGTTELELVSGVYVNKVAIVNGPAAQRGTYVGTVRSDGSSQINDSLAKRHVWNMYNRVQRPMRALDSTDSWTYSTAAWRQANNSSANQLDVVRGLNEDAMRAFVTAMWYGGVMNYPDCYVGVGLDSTTALASGCITGLGVSSFDATQGQGSWAMWDGLPGLGRHYIAWIEYGDGTGTQTWYGDGGGAVEISGITGAVFA